ncbi:MAG: aldo/keto reductase [Ruminococcus sp.]|nr:aldo/keto reductase [Ruminococcus sp.]
MKTIKFGSTDLQVPVIGLGCMRLSNLDENATTYYIQQCLDLGINLFDHADIYGGGECESRFARAIKALSIPREKIIIQSKCGIVPGKMYDFSYDYIIKSVDGILKRLNTDYLDILLLHRPDALVEPEEVAAAFDKLESSGKVRYFGVSNHKPSQIELLKKYVKQDIQANQMQLSIPFSSMISTGLEANMMTDGAVNRDGDVLDYCRLNNITVQAWSPFQSTNGVFVDSNEKFPDLNWTLGELSAKYNASKTTIAAAWILRHPAKIQTIAGTINSQRLSEIAKAAEINLTREEWYKLYLSAGHILP